MEKYSSWRDIATGIQPFVPLVKRNRGGASETYDWIVGIILLIIRLPLFALINISYLVSLNFLFLLEPILPHLLGRPIALVNKFHCRLILFCFGIYQLQFKRCLIKNEIGGEGNTISVVPARSAPTMADQVQAGDIIICNHQSYLDVILLTATFSPIFTVVSAKEPHKIHLVPRWAALFGAAMVESQPEGRELTAGMIDDAPNPIVIFAEGTTTNGRGLLKYSANLELLSRRPNQRIHLMGIKYATGASESNFSLAYPIHSPFRMLHHLLTAMMQWNNIVTTRWISAKSFYEWSAFDLGQPQKAQSQLIDVTAHLLHLRPLTLSVKDKVSFLAIYK